MAKIARIFSFVFALVIAASFGGAAHAQSPSGWDYNLTKKCAKTPHPGQENYYQELTECQSGKNWTLVVEAEKVAGQSCVGPNDQSYLINGPDSPVTLNWIAHTSDLGNNWTANLKVDTSNITPCNNDQYTFFGFFDNADLGGGPLPGLTNLQSSHEIAYQQYAAAGGEARLTIGAQVFWGGKAHILEILPARIGYNTNPGLPSGVIQKVIAADTEYVILDDSWGVKIDPTGATQFVYVDWANIYAKLIQLGMFTSPGSGQTATQAVYVAVETRNKAVTNLWHTNFRVSAK